MGEEPIEEKSPAMLPVRLIAVPSPSGFDIFYELWTARDKPNLWRWSNMISNKGQMRADIAARLIAAHIIRGQQADPVERVSQSLTEADVLLKLIDSEEAESEAQAQADFATKQAAKGGKGSPQQPDISKVGSGG